MRRVRDVRTFQRYAAAVIVLVPATCVAVGRLFQTDDSDTRRTLDLIAANPWSCKCPCWTWPRGC